ncbi:two-component system, NtrC family, sensor kinase [Thermotomaculum hydrothermale]|uniref:histidine kinase n=1 Tax=Thermotomaculum hydrothermale TaxID=981385 RepID=A0A7R6PLJ0_9BACT|nr:ATP-binding protein [Thermotomaculum hydrothermale]BBB31793.1 two-component system, NtrC family, sensor kinase [Thermotomaculum hydrothermale]
MKQKSIETQILFWFLILTLLPLLVLIYQGHHCSTQAILETKNSQLKSILEWKEENFNKQINDIKHDLSLVSIMSLNKSNSTPMCHTMGCSCSPLLHLYETNKCYKGVGIYSLEGKLIEISGSNLPEQLPEKTINKILKEKYLLIQNKLNTLTVFSTLKNKKTNETTGFIAANIDLKKIFETLLKTTPNFGKTGRIFILSKDGLQLEYRDDKRLIEKNGKPLLKAILNEKEGAIFEKPLSGKEKFIGYRVLKKINSFVVITVDKSETLRWINILFKRSIITGVIVFVIVIFVAIKISKSLSEPLKDLERVSKEILEGNVKARIGRYETKEASAVADAFNAMIDKLTEQSKELAQKSSLAAIGELSSSIVHEMRNPLSSIKLNIKAVADKLKDDKTYSELLNITKTQVLRLETMLSELLNFGKPIELKKSRIKPVDLVEQALEIVSSEISKLEQKTFVISEIGENAYIYGDREHLLRALTNLIKNAAEANPKKGKVTIYIKEKKDKVIISVEDTGKGLSKAVKDMIFKPFFTTKETGTGLGLPIVKKIIEYHNGEIFAENREEGGAKFTIILEKASMEGKDE